MFFYKGITRQLSVSKCSHEDYHGGASASIPFTWESQPGTPKIKTSEYALPPLNPPPSHYSNTVSKRPLVIRQNPKGNLFQTFFPKRITRKKFSLSSSPASSTSSSVNSSFASSPRPTSYSVSSSPMVNPISRGEKEMQSAGPRFSSFGSRVDIEDEEYDECELAISRGEKEMQSAGPRFSSFGSRVDIEDEEYDERELAMSNLMSLGNNTRSSQGCFSFVMKKVFLGD